LRKPKEEVSVCEKFCNNGEAKPKIFKKIETNKPFIPETNKQAMVLKQNQNHCFETKPLLPEML